MLWVKLAYQISFKEIKVSDFKFGADNEAWFDKDVAAFLSLFFDNYAFYILVIMSKELKLSSFYGDRLARPYVVLDDQGKEISDRVDPPRVNDALIGKTGLCRLMT